MERHVIVARLIASEDAGTIKQFFLDPEVAGGLGPNTVFDQSVRPWPLRRLHYVLEGWLGDELLESSPAYIVTSGLAAALRESVLTGYTLDAVQVTLSAQFRSRFAPAEVPSFLWLKVQGAPGQDDFGLITPANKASAPKPVKTNTPLIVSDRALALLRRFRIEQCGVEPAA